MCWLVVELFFAISNIRFEINNSIRSLFEIPHECDISILTELSYLTFKFLPQMEAYFRYSDLFGSSVMTAIICDQEWFPRISSDLIINLTIWPYIKNARHFVYSGWKCLDSFTIDNIHTYIKNNKNLSVWNVTMRRGRKILIFIFVSHEPRRDIYEISYFLFDF